ncbi:MAG: hypothetical protein V1793_10940 [Pseudomonadota bacterium]
MASVEFVKDRQIKEPYAEAVSKVIKECVNKGLIIKSVGSYNQIARMLMPLVTNDEQLTVGLDIMEKAIAKAVGDL